MLESLPENVLYTVFDHVVPPASWKKTPARYQTLLQLSKVSIKCAHAAQKVLYEEAQLDSVKEAVLWCMVVEEMPRARFLALWHTRRLRISIHGSIKYTRDLVERVFGTVPAAHELWLDGVSVRLLSLSILPQLTSCYLFKAELQVEVLREKPRPSLPGLRTLAMNLCNVVKDGRIQDFGDVLCLESFPLLTALACTWSPETSDPVMFRLDKQLTHLYLRRYPKPRGFTYPSLPTGELERASSLKHLCVDIVPDDDLEVLETVPGELISLQLSSDGSTPVTVIERHLLAADYSCLDDLKVLFVDTVDGDEQVVRDATRDACESRDIVRSEVISSGAPEEFVDERQWLSLTRAVQQGRRAFS